MYIEDWNLIGRNEYGLKNEMIIVQTINKDINMKFRLEKFARKCLKTGSVQSKMHVGNTFETALKNWSREKHTSI